MKFVGGYLDLVALEQDGERFELVLVAMAGEADAAKWAQLQQNASGRNGR